jgi:tRNA/rRNA methyltransferase
MHTSHAGNVGAAARAIKVMGFGDLVLVRPRLPGVLAHEDALALASGAVDVLARAQVVDTLVEALDGCTQVLATAMTPRDFGPPTVAPRACFAALAPRLHAAGGRAAFVFGGERHGLANADVWRCHACLSIPTAAASTGYGSLNLAQAVQLIAYEWRQALSALGQGFEVVARSAPSQAADLPAVEAALAHWREALIQIGFLDPRVPKKLMPRLQQLLARAQPSVEELHILRGIARAVQAQTRGGAGTAAQAFDPPSAGTPPRAEPRSG